MNISFSVFNGFPPKELFVDDTNTVLSTLSIKSGDTLILEENKHAPAVIEKNGTEQRRSALRRQ